MVLHQVVPAKGERVSYKEPGKGWYDGRILSVTERRVMVLLDPWTGQKSTDDIRVPMTHQEAVTAMNR